MSAVLIGTSHGTDDPVGQAVVRALLDGVRAARPGLDVREAFVDVQQPEVGDVLAGAVRDAAGHERAAGPAAVVVPLLLSTGYHVRHDIAQAVRAANAAGEVAAAADPLGPHPLLVDILADRYAAAEAAHGP
ncbi:MAG TPA: CbiX/SirB N-terminal domain-containing protein, partial [Promicromonospora sp.]|nr:CbiX/SirB N-terminal domain-containing protein [Promicromonospora sp.]